MVCGWEFLMPGMEIRLPKFIRIENTRLKGFQFFLQISVVLVLSYVYFASNKQYLEKKLPQGNPINWADAASQEDVDVATKRDYAKPFCKFPKSVAYKFSNLWTYQDFKCLVVSSNESYFKIGKDIIYFPTYFHEEWEESAVDRNSSDTTCQKTIINKASGKCSSSRAPLATKCYYTAMCAPGESCYRKCAWKSREHFFTVGVEDQSMAFMNTYQVPLGAGEFSRGSDGVAAPPMDANGNYVYDGWDSEMTPMLTIIVQQQGDNTKEFDCGKPVDGQCRFDAGSYVSMKVGDWLKAASFDLDDVNTGAGKNLWTTYKGANLKPEGPIFRITGAEIEISAEYLGNDFHDVQHNGSKWPWTLCRIIVRGTATWTGMPKNRYQVLGKAGEGGKIRSRYYEGVRFQFTTSTSGTFGVVSWPQIINTFVSMIVFFGLVNMTVELMAQYALGNLSRTYFRACQDPFVQKQIATEGLPSRLATAAAGFYMLSWVDEMGWEKAVDFIDKSDQTGITRDTFNKTLEVVLNNREDLDMSELEMMSEHCFRTLSRNKDRITLSDFCTAVASNEPYDTTSMVKNFDMDRRRGLLERIFDDGTNSSGKLGEEIPVYTYKWGGLLRKRTGTRKVEGTRKSLSKNSIHPEENKNDSKLSKDSAAELT